MQQAQPLTITYHQDPGHGWIEVPKQTVRELKIEREISEFSFMDGDTAYLEEDRDAGLFVTAAKAQGLTYEIREKHTDNEHYIRSFRRFHA